MWRVERWQAGREGVAARGLLWAERAEQSGLTLIIFVTAAEEAAAGHCDPAKQKGQAMMPVCQHCFSAMRVSE